MNIRPSVWICLEMKCLYFDFLSKARLMSRLLLVKLIVEDKGSFSLLRKIKEDSVIHKKYPRPWISHVLRGNAASIMFTCYMLYIRILSQ